MEDIFPVSGSARLGGDLRLLSSARGIRIVGAIYDLAYCEVAPDLHLPSKFA